MSEPSSPLYGIPVKEIARICRVDLATARRWKRGATCPPETALMIIFGDLGALHRDWSGWKISDRGELCSPEGWITTPGAVLAMHFHRSQLSALREEILILKNRLRTEELDQYEEQPLPSQWEFATG